MGKKHYIIPIFVPHRGCPFDCIFCNQKKITGLTGEFSIKEADIQIKEYLNTIENIDEKHIEIAFFGGSFTGIDINIQRELLTIAKKWKDSGIVNDIRISTRPDYINQSIMDFLQQFGVSIIELGVQSMAADVLLLSGRGHGPEDVKKAVEIMKGYQVKIGLQMMIGLPGDDEKKIKDTADAIIDLKPNFVRIYPTLVVRDTHLEKLYREGLYRPLTLDEAVEIGKKLLLKFMKNNIPVIRIGLQPTENILMGREVVSGPFHPSFRQLVESEMFRELLDYLFMEHNIKNKESMEIQVNDGYVSSLVGHKKVNIDFVKNKYKIKKIKIHRNNFLKHGEIKILIDDEDEIAYNLEKFANNAN